jgi:hypothetical protein
MKIIVTTIYENADRKFLNWMADSMKERGQINNEQASKLRNGELEIVRKSDNPEDPMVSISKWEVIP